METPEPPEEPTPDEPQPPSEPMAEPTQASGLENEAPAAEAGAGTDA